LFKDWKTSFLAAIYLISDYVTYAQSHPEMDGLILLFNYIASDNWQGKLIALALFVAGDSRDDSGERS
jgi:hypothetical protein